MIKLHKLKTERMFFQEDLSTIPDVILDLPSNNYKIHDEELQDIHFFKQTILLILYKIYNFVLFIVKGRMKKENNSSKRHQ